MHEPSRALYAFRPSAPPALLTASVAVAAVFIATPFVLAEIADRFDVSLGVAGVVSAVQVGSFAVAAFAAGRALAPRGHFLTLGAGLGVVANLASAAVGSFGLLIVARVAAGAAAGILTWIAWADAVHDRRRLSDIAATAPLTLIVAAPLFGWIVDIGGDQAVFITLAAAHLPNLVLRTTLRTESVIRPLRARSTAGAYVLLVALGVATAGAAAVFIFAAALATEEIGLSSVAASVAFSLNAAGGLLGARLRVPDRSGGWWMLGPAASVALLVLVQHPLAFYLLMTFWGMAWWLAVPDIMRSIAARTDAADGRMGDAQAFMAAGRSTGPLLGGAAIASSGFVMLGVVACVTIALAAIAIVNASTQTGTMDSMSDE